MEALYVRGGRAPDGSRPDRGMGRVAMVRRAVAEGEHDAPDWLAVPTDGLHDLVMAAMLDWVMADAFQHGVDELQWHGPPAFEAPFDLRRAWTRASGGGQRGSIWISDGPPRFSGTRVYWIHRGTRAGAGYRAGWVRVSRESFLSAGSRAAGLPIRVFYRMRRPDVVDRVMARMRARISPQKGWAKYTLEIWTPSR